jgi:8-oxo-dGTP diphosphatase
MIHHPDDHPDHLDPQNPVRFCPYCGTGLSYKHTAGKLRPFCSQCGWIYFPDPKVGTAVMIVQDGSVLLVRRVNQPYAGAWALPAGFMDAHEDPAEAARRECLEETGLDVEITGLLGIYPGHEHTRGADILIVYDATVHAGCLQPGDDADQAAFFPLDALPPLAFKATRLALEQRAKRGD